MAYTLGRGFGTLEETAVDQNRATVAELQFEAGARGGEGWGWADVESFASQMLMACSAETHLMQKDKV